MKRRMSNISKNNYYEENIRFVLFVFFNKNVDNSVDKWNNSGLTRPVYTVFLRDFTLFIVFHNFFNRIILSSFDENNYYPYTDCNNMLVNCKKENYRNFIFLRIFNNGIFVG